MSAPMPCALPVAPVGEVRLASSRAVAMLATASQRAEILLEVGYKIQPVDAPNGLFFVWRPTTAPRKFDKDGAELVGYFVQLGTTRAPARCDCACFRLAGNCKHHLRVRSEVKHALRLLGLVPDPALDAWIQQTALFRAEQPTTPCESETRP